MAPMQFQLVSAEPPRALIVAEVCFLRETLAEVLVRAGIEVCGQSGTLPSALAVCSGVPSWWRG